MNDGTGAPGAGAEHVPALVDGSKKYNHSHVFDDLISDDEDLPGFVAYGFYKLRKRQWIIDFQRDNGKPPTKDECLQYSFTYRGNSLSALRQEAEGALFRFAEDVIESRKAGLVAEAFNHRAITEIADLKTKWASDIADLSGQLRKVTGYRHHIVGHVFGFIVLVLLAFIFTVAIKYEPRLADWWRS
jgi:hypothetical protein